MPGGTLYLGVDGGSSGTRALLVDRDATVCGYGIGGNANHQGQGYRSALAHIQRAVREACDAAHAGPQDIRVAHFALAGIDTDDDLRVLAPALEETLPGLVRLGNDVWAGLRAGAPSGAGVAVNCGSGCGAVGLAADGRSAIIPDLGYLFGDSGGGVQIGRDAVRAVVRAWDGRGEPTALTGPVLALSGQPDVAALYLALYREQVPETLFRRLTRVVFQVAGAGDATATGILERIGTELGRSGAAIAVRLGLQGGNFPFVLTGGAFRTAESPLARAAIARMRQTAPLCRPGLPRVLPVAGAALLAMDAAAVSTGEREIDRFRAQGYGWHPEESYDMGR